MTKLTTKLLLERGLPKSTQLRNLNTLNLSKLHLKSQDLDQELFGQLENLEELDLSDNLINKVPDGLKLPCLRVLNCSNNQLEDVTSLQQFSHLEQLFFEDNLYVTVCDNYKVMYLLPNLLRLNNKDVRSQANHVRLVNTIELTRRVHAHWEKTYRKQLPQTLSAASIKPIAGKFVKSAILEVKYGPSSLKDFTKWRVKQIAEELIASLLSPKEEVKEKDAAGGDKVQALPVLRSPSKKKQISGIEFSKASPSKKPHPHHSPVPVSPVSKRSVHLRNLSRRCNQVPGSSEDCNQNEMAASIQNIPRKSETPQHRKHSQQTAKRSRQGLSEEEPLTKTARALQAGGQLHHGKKDLSTVPRKNGKNKEVIHLEPLHFLQSHSRENSREDFKTQLWSCAFQPCLGDSFGKESVTVATCGGDSVCVIDCETGKVLKKYKVAKEEFFSVAWTCLSMVDTEGQRRKFNVLAAAGRLGIVKLIHVKANFCYGEIKAHKKPISVLCFSPTQETFLFTGSYDKRIILWNIGVPDRDYNFKASQLLTLETCSTPLRMSLVPACPERYLLAACENGCFAWEIGLEKREGRRLFDFEFQFPIYEKKDKDNDFHLVDGLAFLNQDLVVSKSCMQGSLYLWSWTRSLKAQEKKNSKRINAAILAELQWSDTELPYLTLSTCPEQQHVFCGDEKGRVWVYDLNHHTQKKPFDEGKMAPSQILSWPSLTIKGQKQVNEIMINNVTVDPAFKYLVALTDQNIVAIWKII
ncbi:leucine-rich repeat and WD repeat-containing protein 1 [Microcaecilia unicolor]|uniref:Leucine-rich repeat and WD repeat-containing protein 1 n=1 Tax=Microcaecilia unicolor TaxID=1415580 RepID=A0A6P7WEX6_9AMPH|nr:leucine-rich repeat and WD repeat-containing protein 1 [Microcaecilia unicolor]